MLQCGLMSKGFLLTETKDTKHHVVWFHSYEITKEGEFIEMRSKWLPGAVKGMRVTANDHAVSFFEWWKYSKISLYGSGTGPYIY